MAQAGIEEVITSTFVRYESVIICVIRAEFRSTNKGGKKGHVVCTCLYVIFLKLINSSSSLNRENI